MDDSVSDAAPFAHIIRKIEKLIKRYLEGELAIEHVVQGIRSIATQEIDNRRQAVDLASKRILSVLLRIGLNKDTANHLIDLSITLAREPDLCSGSLPVLLLCDVFDSLPLNESEEFFSLVEDKVSIWKEDLFFKCCKNQLLRTCNDLLRRLSRSQNTVFCGKILVFLAKLFPLSERSGLNIASEFNAENITLFSSEDYKGLSDEGSYHEESDEGSASSVPVDYNLYRKFWSLQEYFRQPLLCYTKVHWRQFTSYSTDVLSVFGSFKLDDIKTAQWALPGSSSSPSGKSVYFAKYLTSQKLLELELSDSNFRRYVLVQFLILFQYLQSTVRFKLDSHILTEEQSSWVKNTLTQVYKLLEETPPDGAGFATRIKHILQREESWNAWKNEGCPDFKEARPVEQTREVRPKRKLGDEVKAALASKKVVLGDTEMNRLWNLCPDNWEACSSPKRDFVPSLEKFFDMAMDQGDPVAGAKSRAKSIYQSNSGWRALRLLSQKSPHFFTSSNQPIKSLPLYLESMVMRLAKEFPTQNVAPSQAADEKTDMADYGDSEDELLKNHEESRETGTLSGAGAAADCGSSEPKDTLNKDELAALAGALGADWKKLAPLLSFGEDEILYIASEHEGDAAKQAYQALLVWLEQEPEQATHANLLQLAARAGLKGKLTSLLVAE
ncbi:THO complex subunit 1 isoform X1 [Rhipicephalus sanguineus]|uniref:THO complex subunit 1 isoform X1 n=1 Tax=Rhipicephalus sanguineus TaxID=34632 RepID=UPI0020C1DD17|nr:THO complex subunit 1 isoform X1 [Rhipicephalus sanguineus]